MAASGTHVASWVQELTERTLGPSPLRIGGRYQHPDHGIILVTDGAYWGTHGLSNWWRWTVEATGEQKSGYGGRWPPVE